MSSRPIHRFDKQAIYGAVALLLGSLLVTGVLSAKMAGHAPTYHLLGVGAAVVYWFVVSWRDVFTRRVPNSWALFGGLVAGLVVLFSTLSIPWAVAGAAVAFVVLFVAYLADSSDLGGGDVKLAAVAGLMGGFPYAIVGLGLAVCLETLTVSVIKIWTGRKYPMPFAPFLGLGVLIILL